MQGIKRHKSLAVGAVAGIVSAAATLGVEHRSSALAVFFLVPGFLFAVAISGNVHAFPLSLAATGNFLFWLLLCWLVGSLIAKIRKRRYRSDNTDSSMTSG
jgi:hypothetical protein